MPKYLREFVDRVPEGMNRSEWVCYLLYYALEHPHIRAILAGRTDLKRPIKGEQYAEI